MFKAKNDPLVDSVKKVMQENEIRRRVETELNEHLGIASKKALSHEFHAEYDSVLAEAIKEALVGNQHKIDVNNNGKVDGQDFKMLKAGVRKEEANKGLGAMGVPGNVKPHSQVMAKEEVVGGAEDSPTLETGGNTKPSTQSAKIKKAMNEAAYSAKAGRAGKDLGKAGKMFKKIAAKAEKSGAESGEAVAGAILKKIRAKHMKEGTNLPLAEKTLTNAEKSEREHLVKKMKGGDWSKRYGDRGKEVMYATATKMAKKLAEADTISKPVTDASGKVTGFQVDVSKLPPKDGGPIPVPASPLQTTGPKSEMNPDVLKMLNAPAQSTINPSVAAAVKSIKTGPAGVGGPGTIRAGSMPAAPKVATQATPAGVGLPNAQAQAMRDTSKANEYTAKIQQGLSDYQRLAKGLGKTPSAKDVAFNRSEIVKALAGGKDSFAGPAKGRYDYLRTGQGTIRESEE